MVILTLADSILKEPFATKENTVHFSLSGFLPSLLWCGEEHARGVLASSLISMKHITVDYTGIISDLRKGTQ